MSVPEPEPWLLALQREDVCITRAPPPEKTPPQFVRFILLMAVRDEFDRITLRPDETSYWYDMFGRYRGEEFAMIGPTTEATQKFPAILSSLGRATGAQGRPQHAGPGPGDDWESGEFTFPVGASLVFGTYQVRWVRGIVAELEIGVPLVSGAIAEAASHDMWESAKEVREKRQKPDPAT